MQFSDETHMVVEAADGGQVTVEVLKVPYIPPYLAKTHIDLD
jgi:hypothetical protein